MKRLFTKSLALLSVLVSLAFWVLDSCVDAFLLEESESFYEAFFMPEPAELWMRSIVVVLMIVFGMYARRLLNSQQQISDELTHYKNGLEQIVEERTKKLAEINVLLTQEIAERKEVEKKLQDLAITDSLTQLYNRRKFDELLDFEIEKDKRYQLGVSLIYCDIDNFKAINDTYGHEAGDEVLIKFSKLMKELLRESDIVARWGGEEFIILIPNKTAEVARTIAEKMRKALEDLAFPNIGTVTASFGVTHYINQDTKHTMFRRVDEALYSAKANGRNRVEVIV